MNNTFWKIAIFLSGGLFLVLSGSCGQLHAQIPLTAQGTTYSQDFNTLANSGTSSTVPAGWGFLETGTGANTTYTANDGSFNTGDVYSYGTTSATERAFGQLRSGTVVPILGAQFVNQTGATIRELTITYQGEQWRLGALNRVDRMNFQFSTTATALNSPASNWTSFAALNFTAPTTTGTVGALDGNNPVNNDIISASISGFTINNNANFWIRWTDQDATGADDGLSIDNFSIYGCSGVFICPQNMTACLNAGVINLPGSPPEGVYSGPGISGNTFNPVAAGVGTHTITFTYGINSCFETCQFTITVISCPTLPFMQWLPLAENGIQSGSCISESDCNNNTLCFALQYFPGETGVLTSYTTGFFIDCDSGDDPVLSHESCVMTTGNDNEADACTTPGFLAYYHNFSGASPGSANVIAGVGVNLHQVCYSIPSSGSLSIVEEPVTDLTTSLTLEDETFITEYPAYTDFDFDSITYCGILPVRFISFEVTRVGEYAAALDWVTTDEINNHHFEIQRSFDAGKTFTTIGQVDAVIQPRSTNVYHFTDLQVHPGINHYRLRQVDRDGRFTYSPIRTLTVSTDAFTVRAWPNPVQETLQVYISQAETEGMIRLIDITGRLVREKSFRPGDSVAEIDINGLVHGVYSLFVQSGQAVHIEKIMVR